MSEPPIKKILIFFAFSFILVLGVNIIILPQNKPVLYFCEKYVNEIEVGITDRFTTGSLTVMVQCDYALNVENCSIQLDKYNMRSKHFEFFKIIDFRIDPIIKKVSLSEDKLSFENPGIYRVSFLDDRYLNVASAIVEIIAR